MTPFWIITGALALAVAALLVLALLRGRRDTGPAQAFDLQVYRDQLEEIDRDAARGVIAGDEAERLRTEVSRRILAADVLAQDAGDADGQPRALKLAMAGLIGAVLIGGGYGLYARLGAPGYGDLALADRIAAAQDARENRPSQEAAEAQIPPTAPVDAPEEYRDLVQRLRGAVAERPDDLQGHVLLARSEAALGDFVAARKAQERIVEIKGGAASAEDYVDLADMMVLAAGGYVSPEAQDALEAALQMDPQNGVARYYAGLMMAQTGRPDVAFRMWDRLLRESGPDDSWVPPVQAQIEEMAFRAGVSDYRIPTIGGRGPSAADIEAAGDMTAEERQEMISGMVARLSDRLATEGGPPEDWSRLIGAYGVLGQTDRAAAIWLNAQEVFAGNQEALAIVRQGAAQAGVAGVTE
ncbi:c-type cytochrome biogenesis protein CcmI [Aestuariicoccus sp. MJ-SS9]|uniref:c-type cytochrome biogenesis protein CcmI n=1 Tax=Aestuariicoccus sp. MJ-SS9 TaxID=3079855 RepID=UPI002907E529|nr:c-type cytochrome biogenesis protein CcmI [Aestuariicoccus sp. MJ-SS9]MDU8912562.1 c-type cytochrome biogenesis protein CcmI [Aestuariicoccus sp. MJ-SS9]